MIDISKNGKVVFHWKVSPYDYSSEMVNNIKEKAHKKYGIPKEKINVVPDFTILDNEEEIALNKDIVQNIQDPAFQIGLFKQYLSINNITDYDFDFIKKIDEKINSLIDYQVYDKYRRYSIKWLRWDNFLSYGADNYFDFSNLHGLVLLSGNPANQSGKTTFGIDLIHFLLFGRTDKADIQSKIFNKHLPDATTVTVEGCICIDGNDYIIKRTLSRPSSAKRTSKSKVTQKVEYYKIVGTDMEELVDEVDDLHEENSAKTNKVIKEAIGNESDFDLVMSITEPNLDALIDKKDSERGRLLSRWIGLLPLEDKDGVARGYFNENVKPYLLSNRYNEETLKTEIDAYKTLISEAKKEEEESIKMVEATDKEIKLLEDKKTLLNESRLKVDDDVMKIDSVSLKRSISDSKSDIEKKSNELERYTSRIKEIGEVDFSANDYDELTEKLSKNKELRAVTLERYKRLKSDVEQLKNSEICPVCKRKLDNVDHSEHIKEIESELEVVITEGKQYSAEITSCEEKINGLKLNRELYNEKSKLTMASAALEVSLSRSKDSLRNAEQLLEKYNENSAAIDKNNEIALEIRNCDANLINSRKVRDNYNNKIIVSRNKIESYNKDIDERNTTIEKIKEERNSLKNWKIYLDMVGKNGVSKMVLRKTLPIINARLSQMLEGICDFDVNVAINDKNEVMFRLVKDGIYSDLSSGSGFERTTASLALRSVLSELSTIPKNSFILLDEITGRVASDNLENIHMLIDRISKNYSFVFIITHLAEVKEWATANVVVSKVDNISKIAIESK